MLGSLTDGFQGFLSKRGVGKPLPWRRVRGKKGTEGNLLQGGRILRRKDRAPRLSSDKKKKIVFAHHREFFSRIHFSGEGSWQGGNSDQNTLGKGIEKRRWALPSSRGWGIEGPPTWEKGSKRRRARKKGLPGGTEKRFSFTIF